jgi:hypothetical protein
MNTESEEKLVTAEFNEMIRKENESGIIAAFYANSHTLYMIELSDNKNMLYGFDTGQTKIDTLFHLNLQQ